MSPIPTWMPNASPKSIREFFGTFVKGVIVVMSLMSSNIYADDSGPTQKDLDELLEKYRNDIKKLPPVFITVVSIRKITQPRRQGWVSRPGEHFALHGRAVSADGSACRQCKGLLSHLSNQVELFIQRQWKSNPGQSTQWLPGMTTYQRG